METNFHSSFIHAVPRMDPIIHTHSLGTITNNMTALSFSTSRRRSGNSFSIVNAERQLSNSINACGATERYLTPPPTQGPPPPPATLSHLLSPGSFQWVGQDEP